MQNAISRRSFIAAIPLTIGALAVLGGCGEDSDAEPLDLTGTWVCLNDDGSRHITAVIEGKEITIYLLNNYSNVNTLLWAGSYEAPDKATNSWSWNSKRDTDEYKYILPASDDENIEFSYKNDVIKFEITLYGEPETVEMQRITGGHNVIVTEEDGHMIFSWTVNGIESSINLQVSETINNPNLYQAFIIGEVAESTIFIVKEGRAPEANEYGNSDYGSLNVHGSEYDGISRYTWTVDGIETSIQFPTDFDYSKIIVMVIDATLDALRQEGEI